MTATTLAGAALTAQPTFAAISFHFIDAGAIQPDEAMQAVNKRIGLTLFAFTNPSNGLVAVNALDSGTLATQASGRAFAEALVGSFDNGEIFLTDPNSGFGESEFNVTPPDVGRIEQVRVGIFASIPTIPEPASWGLVLAGFAAVGYAVRRRRRVRVNFV